MSEKFVDPDAVQKARSLQTLANAQAASLRLQRMQGKVLDREKVAAAEAEIAGTIRDRLMALPGRLAPVLAERFGLGGRTPEIEDFLINVVAGELGAIAGDLENGE